MSKSPIYIMKNGKEFPGWVYGKLYAALGEYGAGRALYRVRNAENPPNYALKGLREGWIGESTTEMDYNKTAMEAWIAKNIHREAPAPKPKISPMKKKYATIDGKKVLVGKEGGRAGDPTKINFVLKDII